MKCVLGLMILAILSAEATPLQGPCVRRLLATGDKVEDTAQFIMYLELLLQERVIQVQDLDSFLKALAQDKITNPIPSSDANKEFTLHHAEFQKLLDSGSFDLTQIKTWVNSVILKTQAVEKQKEETRTETEELPFVTPDGTIFYRFKHPLLGMSYKILKPNGNYQNEKDWEKTIWPVKALRDSKNHFLTMYNIKEINNGMGHYVMPMKDSPAKKACVELGEGIDLPSKNDYIKLLKHFNPHTKGTGPQSLVSLDEEGHQAFKKIFPDSADRIFWTSTIDKAQKTPLYSWIFDGDFGRIMSGFRLEDRFVRCIGKVKP